ncbi:MAG TPA: hypothetical protein DCS63_10765 [Elusimicrobia bacterium]|nr:hypothetical protein [Elusimicrobiota bacterium]
MKFMFPGRLKNTAIAAVLVFISAHAAFLGAAEFEMTDKLTVNGFTLLKSSAEVRGTMGISTGVPCAALDVVSTGTAHTEMAQIWRESGGVIKASMSATGVMMAVKFIGDGSGLAGITAGDDLGNHIATTTLQMGAYGINMSSHVSAAAYQINGSTVLAILPGSDSLGIGLNAGKVNSGGWNLFVGPFTGESNTTGNSNTYVGSAAGFSHPTGYQNTFIGELAGGESATGDNNTLVGAQVGYEVSGRYNTFVGVEAGYYAEGDNNSFFGYNTGVSLDPNADDNTFIGSNSGVMNAGRNNSFLGSNSGYRNDGGGDNTLAGYKAGYNNSIGSGNAVLGSQAGYGVAGQSFSSATLAGYKAGFGLTTGSDNVLLGFQSGNSLTTGSRNIIIGYDEDAPAATTNDYINIGGLLHGDMALSTMTVYGDLYANHFYGDISGASGLPSGDDLGNHIATQSLNMAGYQITNVSTMTVSSITTTAAGVVFSTNVFITQGKVGIGITSPSSQLHVVVPTTDMNALVIATGTAAGQEIVRISTSGVIYAKGGITYGGDLAEMYLVEGEVEAGDVVMLAKSGSEGVAVERAEGMGVLMGVVATRPGMMLGDGDLGETGTRVPVALSGRVPVKASLENGPIRAGSLLSISSKPGWAAAAIHTGPVMGMALEDFDPRKGDTVLCFVNRHYWVEPGELEQLRDELDRVKAELRRR